jgi:hypothetical protein
MGCVCSCEGRWCAADAALDLCRRRMWRVVGMRCESRTRGQSRVRGHPTLAPGAERGGQVRCSEREIRRWLRNIVRCLPSPSLDLLVVVSCWSETADLHIPLLSKVALSGLRRVRGWVGVGVGFVDLELYTPSQSTYVARRRPRCRCCCQLPVNTQLRLAWRQTRSVAPLLPR